MGSDYGHLHDSVRAFALEDAETRIRRIRMDRWIGYARAESTLLAFEDLLAFPRRTRMPNLLLVGPTNNGKTMIVEKFRRSHPPVAASDSDDGIASVPVVRMQMPAGPDEARFFGGILEVLGAPYGPRDRTSVLQDAAMRFMRLTNVRMLVIDELHNLLSGSPGQQRRLLNLLRWLGNELQIPLVAVGTVEALRAVRSDDQLANRFEPIPLPVWSEDEAYLRLLSTLEAILPLQRPSNLASAALAGKIFSASEGVLGEIVTIVTRAAVLAVRSGTEAITARMIDDTGFIAPSGRRRVAL